MANSLVPCKLSDPDVRVVRSSRRSLAVEVHDGGGVLVRAPRSASDEQIESFLRRKSLWLYAKRLEAKQVQLLNPSPLVAGSSILYAGRSRRIRVTREGAEAFHFDGAEFWVRAEELPHITEWLRAWLEVQAKETIPLVVSETADRLGFKYREVRVADLKTRWGSFSRQAVLTFNWRLIMAPPFVLRYVVAHELAHTVEPNHGPRFWNLVLTICPRTEEAKVWLARNEGELERLP